MDRCRSVVAAGNWGCKAARTIGIDPHRKGEALWIHCGIKRHRNGRAGTIKFGCGASVVGGPLSAKDHAGFRAIVIPKEILRVPIKWPVSDELSLALVGRDNEQCNESLSKQFHGRANSLLSQVASFK